MKAYITSLLILSLMTLSACSSTGETSNNRTMIATPVFVATEEVSLTGIPAGKPIKVNDDSKDLRKIVELAIARSDKGEHAAAGEIFLKAFKSFRSNDKRIEEALISAAIIEFFQDGKIEKTRECLALLDTFYTSVYNNFDTNASVAKIRKILSHNK